MTMEPTPIIPLIDGMRDYIGKPKRHYQPIDNSTGRLKMYNGLTAKQENFCRYIANGETMAGAYRKAYETRPELRPDSVYNRASMLAKRDDIKARIDQLLSERETLAINDYAQIRKFIIERLQIEALQAKNDAVRVKALEMLGKIDKIQLFADGTKDSEVTASVNKDMKKELEDRLIKLMGGALPPKD